MVLDSNDTTLLEDDTYTYELTQNSVYLKSGFVRLIIEVAENSRFDYKMDFLMA